MPFLLLITPKPFFNVHHLSLVSTGPGVNVYAMHVIDSSSIESLEIKDCEGLQHVYMKIKNADQDNLRKFKITFPRSKEARERAYAYWRHHVEQMRWTLDFLRAATFNLDELEIQGDFGDPSLHPVEFSGMSPELYFAIEAHQRSLVRLHVVNTDIDFSFEELARILCTTPRLTQLAITCRSFTFRDGNGYWVQQGLGVSLPQHLLVSHSCSYLVQALTASPPRTEPSSNPSSASSPTAQSRSP